MGAWSPHVPAAAIYAGDLLRRLELERRLVVAMLAPASDHARLLADHSMLDAIRSELRDRDLIRALDERLGEFHAALIRGRSAAAGSSCLPESHEAFNWRDFEDEVVRRVHASADVEAARLMAQCRPLTLQAKRKLISRLVVSLRDDTRRVRDNPDDRELRRLPTATRGGRLGNRAASPAAGVPSGTTQTEVPEDGHVGADGVLDQDFSTSEQAGSARPSWQDVAARAAQLIVAAARSQHPQLMTVAFISVSHHVPPDHRRRLGQDLSRRLGQLLTADLDAPVLDEVRRLMHAVALATAGNALDARNAVADLFDPTRFGSMTVRREASYVFSQLQLTWHEAYAAAQAVRPMLHAQRQYRSHGTAGRISVLGTFHYAHPPLARLLSPEPQAEEVSQPQPVREMLRGSTTLAAAVVGYVANGLRWGLAAGALVGAASLVSAAAACRLGGGRRARLRWAGLCLGVASALWARLPPVHLTFSNPWSMERQAAAPRTEQDSLEQEARIEADRLAAEERAEVERLDAAAREAEERARRSKADVAARAARERWVAEALGSYREAERESSALLAEAYRRAAVADTLTRRLEAALSGAMAERTAVRVIRARVVVTEVEQSWKADIGPDDPLAELTLLRRMEALGALREKEPDVQVSGEAGHLVLRLAHHIQEASRARARVNGLAHTAQAHMNRIEDLLDRCGARGMSERQARARGPAHCL
jgi:hypothetical protein